MTLAEPGGAVGRFPAARALNVCARRAHGSERPLGDLWLWSKLQGHGNHVGRNHVGADLLSRAARVCWCTCTGSTRKLQLFS